MDGRLAHVELPGDLVLGATAPDRGDHRLATKGLPVSFSRSKVGLDAEGLR
jgi:hypothetical protein